MKTTRIEWAERTWNPITGCSKISDGCRHCYAERMAKRMAGRFGYPADDPFRVVLHEDKLFQPSGWKKPSRIFVGSMGDLFHVDVNLDWLENVFREMEANPRHTFILLTKRPGMMAAFLKGYQDHYHGGRPIDPHIWIGVTTENQEQADKRIPLLLQVPASVRFVSVEPMLGLVELREYVDDLDWVVCGGETGPGARPMQTHWAQDLHNRCEKEAVPFFFKKHGDWWMKHQNPFSTVRDVNRELYENKKIEEWPETVGA